MAKFVSRSTKETTEIAKVFVQDLLRTKSSKAKVVGLVGNLGAGKTAFTQAAAKLLKAKGRVNSPTFVIMKKYPIKTKNHKFLYHLDAYRLKTEGELLHLGWGEIIADKDNIVFIEWPENVKKAMPRKHKKVSISHTKGETRTIRF